MCAGKTDFLNLARLRMSAYRGRPEVTGGGSKRRF
jgi:hypothetical protein